MTTAQATALAPDRDRIVVHDRPPGTLPWMTMQEVATYLEVPYNSLVQKWRVWGLSSYKIGRERKFLRPEVEAWVRNQREGGDPPAQISA
jgi:excisionase family DNA binding protein